MSRSTNVTYGWQELTVVEVEQFGSVILSNGFSTSFRGFSDAKPGDRYRVFVKKGGYAFGAITHAERITQQEDFYVA